MLDVHVSIETAEQFVEGGRHMDRLVSAAVKCIVVILFTASLFGQRSKVDVSGSWRNGHYTTAVHHAEQYGSRNRFPQQKLESCSTSRVASRLAIKRLGLRISALFDIAFARSM